MFTRAFLFLPVLFLSFLEAHPLPDQTMALEESEEDAEEELLLPRESLFSEEEEISALPKKGSRPQVIQIPSKSSLPH